MTRVDAWLLTAAPARRLALWRVAVSAYALVWLLVRLPEHLRVRDFTPERWDPVGPFHALDAPPADIAVVALAAATPLMALAVLVGWRFRWTGPAFAAGLLLTTSLDSSWGQIFHTENVLVLHAIVLAFAPAADALAIGRGAAEPAPSPSYGLPLRIGAVITVLSYVVAGVAKLRIGGLGWLDGSVLRDLVAHDNLRKELLGDRHSPVGAALVSNAGLFTAFAVATFAVELGAVVALAGRRFAALWAWAAWFFHVGVLALMAILFPYQLTGIAFAPLFALERGEAVLARWLPSAQRVPAAHPPLRTPRAGLRRERSGSSRG